MLEADPGTNDDRPRATHPRFARILGIRFLDAEVSTAVDLISRGGLMVVPSAPGLATLPADSSYRQAVAGSDFAIVDSAYLALLWLVLRRERLHRVSGLEFLRAFLAQASVRERGALFLVNPSDADGDANLRWLRVRGFDIGEQQCYTAPIYDRRQVSDPRLKELLDVQRPRHVMLNVGSGTQEPLGFYLKHSLSYAPGIICTGAAIAFLSGRQAQIPEWVDSSGLGWLARCIQNPRLFVPRYLGAVRLGSLIRTYGQAMPPLTGRRR